jgi:hypothetical protein
MWEVKLINAVNHLTPIVTVSAAQENDIEAKIKVLVETFVNTIVIPILSSNRKYVALSNRQKEKGVFGISFAKGMAAKKIFDECLHLRTHLNTHTHQKLTRMLKCVAMSCKAVCAAAIVTSYVLKPHHNSPFDRFVHSTRMLLHPAKAQPSLICTIKPELAACSETLKETLEDAAGLPMHLKSLAAISCPFIISAHCWTQITKRHYSQIMSFKPAHPTLSPSFLSYFNTHDHH